MSVIVDKIIQQSRDLTTKEKIQIKNGSGIIKLDAQFKAGEEFVITGPVDYLVKHIEIEDDNGDKREFDLFIIIDGEWMYSTSSSNVLRTLADDLTDLNADGESYSIKFEKKPSKRFSGSTYLSYTIL